MSSQSASPLQPWPTVFVAPKTNVPTEQIDEARQALRDSARDFLQRLYASFMLELHELEASAERLGTGFEPYELERGAPV